MKLKPITREERDQITRADEYARSAQRLLRLAGATKAAQAIARARKSIGGAIRHASRRPIKESPNIIPTITDHAE